VLWTLKLALATFSDELCRDAGYGKRRPNIPALLLAVNLSQLASVVIDNTHTKYIHLKTRADEWS